MDGPRGFARRFPPSPPSFQRDPRRDPDPLERFLIVACNKQGAVIPVEGGFELLDAVDIEMHAKTLDRDLLACFDRLVTA